MVGFVQDMMKLLLICISPIQVVLVADMRKKQRIVWHEFHVAVDDKEFPIYCHCHLLRTVQQETFETCCYMLKKSLDKVKVNALITIKGGDSWTLLTRWYETYLSSGLRIKKVYAKI